MTHTKIRNRKSERGGAGVKLLAVLLVLACAAHAAYNFIPVAYDGANFKQEMQTAVVQGMAPPPNVTPTDIVKIKLQRAMSSNNIPADAVVQVKATDKSILAHVTYSKKVPIIPFGIYAYNYQFDHTATPTGFLLKD